MKRVLITGSTGYIGSNLARRFINNGIEVHSLVLPDINYEYIEDIKNEINYYVYDNTTESVFEAVKKSKPDIVYHLASLFLSEHKSEDIINLINSNILLGAQILEAMSKTGIKQLINTGTSWQHYLNENYNPVNLYASTKQAFEDILRYYTETGYIRAISLHLFDTYGPGDNRPKLFKLLKNAADKDETLNMSPGEQLIDLVYIDDVIDAYISAAEHLLKQNTRSNLVYLVSSSSPIPLKEIVELYRKISQKMFFINWGGRPYRAREVMTTCNNYPILPNWHPRWTLESGLKKIIDQTTF